MFLLTTASRNLLTVQTYFALIDRVIILISASRTGPFTVVRLDHGQKGGGGAASGRGMGGRAGGRVGTHVKFETSEIYLVRCL